MSQINKHNYEAFLLDYSEGVLPAEEVAELLLFIEKNANLNIDLDDFDLPYLSATDEEFEEKAYLKDFPRIEQLVIGHTENVLTKDENQELSILEQKYSAVKFLKEDYQSTILPYETIEHPNKRSLKRTRVIPMYYWTSAAAAVFIGIIITLNISSIENGDYSAKTNLEEIKKIDKVTLPNFTNMAIINKDTAQSAPKKAVKTPVKNSEPNLANSGIIKTPNTPTIITPKDTASLVPESVSPTINDLPKDEIAITEKDTVSQEIPMNQPNELAVSDHLTVKEFLKVKTKEIILKEEAPNLDPINGNELLANLAESVNSKTKMAVAFQNEESDSKKVTKFKLGKFEFYKSSSK